MREIKFRAWNTVHKRMEEVNVNDGEPVRKGCQWFNSSSMDTVGRSELMQFTGLKDKNGTEIYEGDIVRVSGTDELGITDIDVDENCVVKWDEFGTGFYSDCINKREILIEPDIPGYYNFDRFPLFGFDEELMFEFEVIGNIYENQKLQEVVNNG